MTPDEWMKHKDFDELSREMNGEFGFSALNMLTTEGSFLSPKSGKPVQSSAQSTSEAPRAE